MQVKKILQYLFDLFLQYIKMENKPQETLKEIEEVEDIQEPSIDFKKPQRTVNRVFLHCSASENPLQDNINAIRELHKAPKTEKFQWGKYKTNGKGWVDVGYHFFITKNGDLQEGRSLEKNPAAQAGHNTGTIAICLSGESAFTKAQFDTLKALCNAINKAYKGKITFHGHCEVSDKLCPVFDYKSILKLQDGKLGVF